MRREGGRILLPALAGKKCRCLVAKEMVWEFVITNLVHTTRCKHPSDQTDNFLTHTHTHTLLFLLTDKFSSGSLAKF